MEVRTLKKITMMTFRKVDGSWSIMAKEFSKPGTYYEHKQFNGLTRDTIKDKYMHLIQNVNEKENPNNWIRRDDFREARESLLV